MISEQEYRAMLARATQIAALDPLPNSELGEELEALADALEEYERVHFPDMATPLPAEEDDNKGDALVDLALKMKDWPK